MVNCKTKRAWLMFTWNDLQGLLFNASTSIDFPIASEKWWWRHNTYHRVFSMLRKCSTFDYLAPVTQLACPLNSHPSNDSSFLITQMEHKKNFPVTAVQRVSIARELQLSYLLRHVSFFQIVT